MTCQELYQLARQRLQKAGVDSPGVDAALLTQGFLNLTRTGLALHGEETPTPVSYTHLPASQPGPCR